MNCPKCDGNSRTVETKPTESGRKRKHKCVNCSNIFYTIEITMDEYQSLMTDTIPVVQEQTIPLEEQTKLIHIVENEPQIADSQGLEEVCDKISEKEIKMAYDNIVTTIEKDCGVRAIESEENCLYYLEDDAKQRLGIMTIINNKMSYTMLKKKQVQTLINELQDIYDMVFS